LPIAFFSKRLAEKTSAEFSVWEISPIYVCTWPIVAAVVNVVFSNTLLSMYVKFGFIVYLTYTQYIHHGTNPSWQQLQQLGMCIQMYIHEQNFSLLRNLQYHSYVL
jgi:hypothetical protein